MAESIKLPARISGSPEAQLHQLYSYLYRMAQTLNVNLKEIGSSVLTKDEQDLMNSITQSLQEPGELPAPAYNYAEAETLKSLIIKTAQFVKNEVDNYRLVLFGEESAEGSQGNWKRKKGLRVDVTPDGTQQTYSYAEIIQGLKTFEINAKNYIKTGLLRTVNGVPVYGVAIGKDIVTFSEDGTETYNDGNKVAELIADALTFYQGEHPVAKFTGSKLSFYINGSEIFYIQGGKIYCAQDLELASGKKLIINTSNFKIDSSGNVVIKGNIDANGSSKFAGQLVAASGTFRGNLEAADGTFKVDAINKNMIAGNWKFDNNGFILTTQDGNVELKKSSSFGVQFYLSAAGLGDTTSYSFEETEFYGKRNTVSPAYPNLGNWSYPWGTIYYNNLSQVSSRDRKHNIQPLPDRSAALDALVPVEFVYNEDAEERKRAGLIYEDTIGIMPEICTGDENKKAINYVELIPFLLKETQELRKRMKVLEEKVQALESKEDR